MKNPIKFLLNKFSVTNVSQKDVKKQFDLMLETLKGSDLPNLAEVTTRLTGNITVRDEGYLKLQSDLFNWVKDTKEQSHRLSNVTTISEFISTVLTHIEKEIAPDLQYEISSRLNSDNYVSAMKYDTFYVVRLVELCDFAVNYSAMLLHYVLKINTDEEVLARNGTVEEMNKVSMTRLNHYLYQYLNVCNCLLGIKDMKNQFKAIPPTLISTDEITSFGAITQNAGALDPFKLGFIGVAWNPAYYLGKWMAEREHSTYLERQERAKVITIRLNYLKGIQANRADPNSEKRIAMLESDLAKLEHAILKYERNLWEEN
jgi:hypothetical protein